MKDCIINVAFGQWYPKGQKRLVNSLIHHGYAGDILTWTNDWPNGNYDGNNLYCVKSASLEESINKGFTHILWLDCSMWAIKNPKPIFDYIDEHGVYAETNGYNASQECSDKCLKYFGVTRDEAENIPMCSSGVLGININNPLGKEFSEMWIQSAKDGIWDGSRGHGKQSHDKRFLHHRQDQSAASIIIHKLGIKLNELGTHFNYYGQGENEKTIFLCQGMG